MENELLRNIALVVPVYNPHQQWASLLIERYNELVNYYKLYWFKLYIVNDGSTKNISSEDFEKLISAIKDIQIIELNQNRGKGEALRTAISKTDETFVIYTDIDMPFTLNSMKMVIDELPYYDLVVGIKEKSYYEQLPFRRKVISKILQFTIKSLLPILPISDTQCGLKGMNQKGKEFFLYTETNRYLFDLEFILYAAQQQLKIKPIEVCLRPGIVFSNMNNKILLQEAKNFLQILRKKKLKT